MNEIVDWIASRTDSETLPTHSSLMGEHLRSGMPTAEASRRADDELGRRVSAYRHGVGRVIERLASGVYVVCRGIETDE